MFVSIANRSNVQNDKEDEWIYNMMARLMIDRTTTIMMSMSIVTVAWKSTAMRMRKRTGVTRISGLRAVGVLRKGREGTGVSGRCPGSREGRASAARE